MSTKNRFRPSLLPILAKCTGVLTLDSVGSSNSVLGTAYHAWVASGLPSWREVEEVVSLVRRFPEIESELDGLSLPRNFEAPDGVTLPMNQAKRELSMCLTGWMQAKVVKDVQEP